MTKKNMRLWCRKNDGIPLQNTPVQYTVIFHGCKNDYFQKKNCDIFLFFLKTYIVGTR